jgi:hypothetical protein
VVADPELVRHTAEAALMRSLYAATGGGVEEA